MSTTTETRFLIEAAVQAPSSHNTQPWVFGIEPGAVSLYADRTRALPVNDPYDRELTISCGAALFNMEVAAKARGVDPIVSILPDPTDPDLLARVIVDRRTDRGDSLALVDTIPHRHSTRDAFSQGAMEENLVEALAGAAANHDVTLVLDLDRTALARLVAEGDRAQFADPRWRRELASWMHPRRRGEGLAVPEVFGLATRAVVSLVDLGASTASADHELITEAPIVAVLATVGDEPVHWIETGRALQHLLLVAATYGASAGYLNQPCQVGDLRLRLQALLPGHDFPQVVVRLGPAPAPKQPSPRRPVDDVMLDGTP